METDFAAAVFRWVIRCRIGFDQVGIGHTNAAAPPVGGWLTGLPVLMARLIDFMVHVCFMVPSRR